MARHPTISTSLLLTAVCLGGPYALRGQAPSSVEVRATALPPGADIELDGRLDELAWTTAQPTGPMTLREPVEGDPAPESTEVRFLYSSDALYVGAIMRSDTPSEISRLVARRDRSVPTEQLIVSFDPRLDRSTAYSFAITPGGVRSDYFHPRDQEGSRDFSYDPVWEARTAVTAEGWVAEIRIPFSQLRYNAGATQEWGVTWSAASPGKTKSAVGTGPEGRDRVVVQNGKTHGNRGHRQRAANRSPSLHGLRRDSGG